MRTHAYGPNKQTAIVRVGINCSLISESSPRQVCPLTHRNIALDPRVEQATWDDVQSPESKVIVDLTRPAARQSKWTAGPCSAPGSYCSIRPWAFTPI